MTASLGGKTVFVTGSTSGIGRAAARALADRGAQVVLHGRDAGRGEEARREIAEGTGNAEVHLLLADLAVQAEVRALADAFRARFDRLDVLVNNAGVSGRYFVDGVPRPPSAAADPAAARRLWAVSKALTAAA